MKTLGDTLRKAREAQGLSLQEVVDKTKIRLYYLECIENGEFEKIPGEVYVKGFIRNYASAVGLDEQEVLDHFHQIRSEQAEALKDQSEKEVAKSATSSKPAKPAKPATPSRPATPASPGKPSVIRQKTSVKLPSWSIILGALIALGLMAGLFAGGLLIHHVKNEKPVATTQQPIKRTVALPKKLVTENNDHLQLKATADSWISLTEKDTGRVIEEGTILHAGETRDWKIEKALILKIGNAGGLQISAFGAPFKYYGQESEVITLPFEPKK